MSRQWEIRLLVVCVACLVALGVASTYSAAALTRFNGAVVTETFVLSQLGGVLLGSVLSILAATADYRRLQRWAPWLFAATLFAVLITVVPGTEGLAPKINGARRWILVSGFRIQPSEMLRFVVLIWVASLCASWGPRLLRWWDGVVPLVMGIACAAGLIVLQPNLSMAAMLTMGAGGVLVVAGLSWKHIAALSLAGLASLSILAVQESYRADRVEAFLGGGVSSENGYQVAQALIGFGSGQWHGVGFGAGMQKFGFLPYAYSDFLFSTIGEEWGFVGVLVVLALFSGVLWMGVRIARTARDVFGQLLAVGCVLYLAIGLALHVAVNLALLPATGIPLPFLSYGKTHLVIALVVVGVLINIGEQRDAPMPTRHRRPRRWAEDIGLRQPGA